MLVSITELLTNFWWTYNCHLFILNFSLTYDPIVFTSVLAFVTASPNLIHISYFQFKTLGTVFSLWWCEFQHILLRSIFVDNGNLMILEGLLLVVVQLFFIKCIMSWLRKKKPLQIKENGINQLLSCFVILNSNH